MVEEISVEELAKMRQDGLDFVLLDVREPSEFADRNLGGLLIPSGELPKRFHELNKDQLIIIHCKGGGRSRRAVEFLLEQGFKQVKNLKGGLMAWEALQAAQK